MPETPSAIPSPSLAITIVAPAFSRILLGTSSSSSLNCLKETTKRIFLPLRGFLVVGSCRVK